MEVLLGRVMLWTFELGDPTPPAPFPFRLEVEDATRSAEELVGETVEGLRAPTSGSSGLERDREVEGEEVLVGTLKL